MNNYAGPKLPFIIIEGLKILIDSGASSSIMNSSVANERFKNYFYPYNFKLTTVKQNHYGNIAFKYPLFTNYNINKPIKFLVLDWNNHYDALISTNDLKQLGAILNYQTNTLTIQGKPIPFYEELNNVNPMPLKRISKTLFVPVKVSGNIYIPETKIKNLIIPEGIYVSRNNYIEIPHESEVEINNLTPIEAEPLSEFIISDRNPFNIHSELNKEIINNIRTEHMNNEERNMIINLCRQYTDIFYQTNVKLSSACLVKHHIRTTNNDPVFTRNFRHPHHMKGEIQKQVEKLLKDEIIRPSTSPYSSPVWIVPKKSDASGQKKWRMVIDYRKLNQATIEDKYPLPRIDDILDNLGKCRYFSTLDLAQGFHQIQIHEDSIEKTAFTVENGHYEYTRMPFGLKMPLPHSNA